MTEKTGGRNTLHRDTSQNLVLCDWGKVVDFSCEMVGSSRKVVESTRKVVESSRKVVEPSRVVVPGRPRQTGLDQNLVVLLSQKWLSLVVVWLSLVVKWLSLVVKRLSLVML